MRKEPSEYEVLVICQAALAARRKDVSESLHGLVPAEEQEKTWEFYTACLRVIMNRMKEIRFGEGMKEGPKEPEEEKRA